jgi:transcription initiation factor TFIIF subunit alpha
MFRSTRGGVANSNQSDDDTSDEEKQKEIDKKKDEEAKNKAKAESKLPSGASSKGTNTPSGRPKHTDPLKKPKGLKRPGSPGLSESSGNESSRKKHKKKHQPSQQATGTSTPLPGSRQISPAPTSQPASGQSPRKSSIIKLNVNASKLSEIQSAPPNPSPVMGGSMSDGEATGAEMSDGGQKKKIKLRIGGRSPGGSRAGTPAPGRAGSPGGGSRAGSPAVQPQSKRARILGRISFTTNTNTRRFSTSITTTHGHRASSTCRHYWGAPKHRHKHR